MMSAPQIFDRQALALRRKRAFKVLDGAVARPDFLLLRVAEDFSERLSVIKRRFSAALDLGCHTGAIGRMLRADHGIADLVSADECLDVLVFAEGSPLAVDLEALTLTAEQFDLVLSAFVLQTVNDVPGALAQVRASLRPDGLFMGAILGGRSLWELREAFLMAETELRGGASPRVAPMIDVRDLGTLLQRAKFALPVVDSDVVEVTYAHPLALLADLRVMGATNVLVERSRYGLRRDVLARAMGFYQERFSNPDGRVRATFEILTATAWAPHGSQQVPLRPGSGQTTLADALKAR